MTADLLATPLLEEHRRLSARLVPFAGWQMPIQYRGIVAEHEAVRMRAGIFDVSHMGELELSGSGAAKLVNELVTNDLERIQDGRAMYTCCCNEAGTILDDLIIYRRSANDVLVVCNASNVGKIGDHFSKNAAGRCEFRNASSEYALLAVQGPRALEIVQAAGSSLTPLSTVLAPFRFKDGTVAGIPCTIARTGYTGEDGVELFVRADRAAELWRAILAVGTPLGLEPAGLGARDTLRLEARLCLYGNDIDETTHPIEAGLAWTVKLDKPGFVGQRALRAIQERGPLRKLVGFEMTGRGIARHGYPLLDASGANVGTCTSGGPSPTLGKNIGLGYLPASMSEPGTEFMVDCRGKPIAAVVVKTPFYKRPAGT